MNASDPLGERSHSLTEDTLMQSCKSCPKFDGCSINANDRCANDRCPKKAKDGSNMIKDGSNVAKINCDTCKRSKSFHANTSKLGTISESFHSQLIKLSEKSSAEENSQEKGSKENIFQEDNSKGNGFQENHSKENNYKEKHTNENYSQEKHSQEKYYNDNHLQEKNSLHKLEFIDKSPSPGGRRRTKTWSII